MNAILPSVSPIPFNGRTLLNSMTEKARSCVLVRLPAGFQERGAGMSAEDFCYSWVRSLRLAKMKQNYNKNTLDTFVRAHEQTEAHDLFQLLAPHLERPDTCNAFFPDWAADAMRTLPDGYPWWTWLRGVGARAETGCPPERCPPLAIACFVGNRALVRQLLDEGANPNWRDRNGHAVLDYAGGGLFTFPYERQDRKENRTESQVLQRWTIVEALLEAGAAPNAPDRVEGSEGDASSPAWQARWLKWRLQNAMPPPSLPLSPFFTRNRL